MKCPACKSPNTAVVDSRPVDDDAAIRRRRSCGCGHRFTTWEFTPEEGVFVVKPERGPARDDRTILRVRRFSIQEFEARLLHEVAAAMAIFRQGLTE